MSCADGKMSHCVRMLKRVVSFDYAVLCVFYCIHVCFFDSYIFNLFFNLDVCLHLKCYSMTWFGFASKSSNMKK